MDIPWKSVSKSYVFGLSNTEHLCRNAQSCIRTSSPALRQWRGESLPHLFGNPALIVWPPHTYSVWPCLVRQKYSCTIRSIISLQQTPTTSKFVWVRTMSIRTSQSVTTKSTQISACCMGYKNPKIRVSFDHSLLIFQPCHCSRSWATNTCNVFRSRDQMFWRVTSR